MDTVPNGSASTEEEFMKKRPLQVALHVREPSIIEFTVGERVQLDRLAPSSRGFVPERHGDLLEPGVVTLALAQGHYCFKTLTDANLRVVRGGAEAHAIAYNKTNGPGILDAKGDEPAGELPTLTFA
jgi:hypothetical protein